MLPYRLRETWRQAAAGPVGQSPLDRGLMKKLARYPMRPPGAVYVGGALAHMAVTPGAPRHS